MYPTPNGSWFPVFDEQFVSSEFQSLTSTEKIYYWYLVSEFSGRLGKKFYRSDCHFAAALGLSEIKIRKARKKFEQLGFIKVTSGTRRSNTNLATIYHQVKWSKPADHEPSGRRPSLEPGKIFPRVHGLPYSQVHRYGFNAMLSSVRNKGFQHRDLVVYVTLIHWIFSKLSRKGHDGPYHLSKRVLVLESGEDQALKCIKRLFDDFQFADGAHLFEYTELYHELVFSNFVSFVDPSTSGKVNERAMRLDAEIEARALALRDAAEKRKQGRAKNPS